MLKVIAGDYFRKFTIRGFKELLKTNAAAFICMAYPLFLWFDWLLGDGKEDGIVFLAIYLPMLYILCSFYLHPVRLCKMMYLCPMGADRRRAYIRYSYWFRVVVHMAAAVAGMVLLMAYARCDGITAAEIIGSDFVLSILIPPKKRDECYGSIDKETICLSCMIAFSILSGFGLMVVVSDKEPHSVLQLVILAVLVVIQLPLTLRYLRYVKSELEAAVYYEEKESL